jgi:hypothetical protein
LYKQEDKFTGGGLTSSQQQEFTNDNYRENIFSVIGGFDLNYNQFVLGIRGGWDLRKNNGEGDSITPRYKNMWYQATIGYRL